MLCFVCGVVCVVCVTRGIILTLFVSLSLCLSFSDSLCPSLSVCPSFSPSLLFTGFDANRDEGLAMLETCYREGGMLAPFAASTWAAYQLDAKTFLGERQTPDDFKRCRRMFRWARKRYAIQKREREYMTLMGAEMVRYIPLGEENI